METQETSLYSSGKLLSKSQRKNALSNGKKMPDEYMEVMVLKNGIERLEVGDLIFEGKQVPIIFWSALGYLEWIDPSPVMDKSTMKIQCLQQKNNIYTNLILTTKSFVFRINRARIDQSDNIIDIHPLSIEK
jgi:hypothetical protein